jgi:hypothetical protein
MADDSMPEHADLATAMDHMVTGAQVLAGSSPSGNPHAMNWFSQARYAIDAWRAKYMPPPVVEDPPIDDSTGDDASSDTPSDDTPEMQQEASQDSGDFSAESSSDPDMAAKAPAE